MLTSNLIHGIREHDLYESDCWKAVENCFMTQFMVNFYEYFLFACEDVYSLTIEWSIPYTSTRSRLLIVWLNSTFLSLTITVKNIKNSYHVCGLIIYPLKF